MYSNDANVRTAQGGQGVVDLFVTDANLIVKGVYSVRFEKGDFTQTAVLSDINTPIKVYAPDPAITHPAP